MYRSALRSSPRVANAFRQSTSITTGRRFASTSPAGKRSWKSSFVRWGLAGGAVYWYSTTAAFAEEPLPKTIQPPPQFSDEDLPTVEAVVAQKRKEAEARSRRAALAPEPGTATLATDIALSAPVKDVETSTKAAPAEGSPEALEEEASQQGAFNPETGEINWDCPCLGGMADGPCGEQFKAAFSCFVYSSAEPKGMDCIEKFQHMQDCFRLHPEVYGEELDDDEAAAGGASETAADAPLAKTASSESDTASSLAQTTSPVEKSKSAEIEAKEVVKETEKQNSPSAQP